MAAKLSMLEEEWTRQPPHPAKTKSNVVFAFNGSTRIDHARQATITQVGGPSYTVSSQGRCIVLNDFTKYISVTKGINFLLADFVILFVFSQVGSVAHGGTMLTFVGTPVGNANRIDIYTLATGVVRADVYNSTGVVSVVDSAPEIHTGGVYAAALEMRSGYLQWRINGKISGSSVGFSGQRDNESSSFTIGEGAVAGAVPNHETALVAFLCGDDRELTLNPWKLFEPEEVPLFKPAVTAQYARPTSDVSAGTWTASTGSDLYAMLDETSANDSDYITTTSATTCEVALGSLTDPAVSTGHIVRYRISATGGGIIVRLREGSTTIASWTHDPAPGSLTTYAQQLSGGEADSITNYAALKLQFEATT